MRFHHIRSRFSNPSWLQTPQELTVHNGVVRLTRNESQLLMREARNSINRGMVQEAQNALYAGLLFDEERFLHSIQKQGLLRVSRMSYLAEPLTSIVSSLQSLELGLSSRVQDYLASVRNLYRVAASIRVEYEELRNWLAEERERGIRGLLGTLDFLFLRRSMKPCEADPSLPSRDHNFHSTESLAAGLSSLLALYFNEFGPLRGNVLIDANAAADGEYYEHLISGAHLAEFREWETIVDRFGYHFMEATSLNTYVLHPVSANFHRALEYGYIQDVMQRMAKGHLWHDPDAKSFVEIGHLCSDKFLKFVDAPLPHYRCEFPEFLFEMISGIEEFTQEEKKTITWACREMRVTPGDLFKFDFGNGVRIDDLFRISRIINFMHGIAATKLMEEFEERPQVVLNSLVPAIRTEMLRQLIGKVIGDEKAEAAIDMLTLKSDGHIDVLYAPLIPCGETVLLPVHVFSQCNIFRNPLMLTQQRLFPDGAFDPLTEHIAQCFKKAGARVSSNVSYSSQGLNGEYDVIALIDDCLFVCECKNSLLPTGVHELRTSLDHIEKAADQLHRFKNCFRDSGFRGWLTSQLGKSISDHSKVVPAIFVSNRMLLGLRVDGIPVRGNQEFENFVDTGVIEYRDTGVIEESSKEICLWVGESLEIEDLRRFFDEDITYTPHWASLEPFVSRFEFSDINVETPRLRLNFIALAGNLGFEDLKRKMIAMARSEGQPIDDEGWMLAANDDSADGSILESRE